MPNVNSNFSVLRGAQQAEATATPSAVRLPVSSIDTTQDGAHSSPASISPSIAAPAASAVRSRRVSVDFNAVHPWPQLPAELPFDPSVLHDKLIALINRPSANFGPEQGSELHLETPGRRSIVGSAASSTPSAPTELPASSQANLYLLDTMSYVLSPTWAGLEPEAHLRTESVALESDGQRARQTENQELMRSLQPEILWRVPSAAVHNDVRLSQSDVKDRFVPWHDLISTRLSEEEIAGGLICAITLDALEEIEEPVVIRVRKAIHLFNYDALTQWLASKKELINPSTRQKFDKKDILRVIKDNADEPQ